MPRELQLLDREKKEINASIVVVGEGAKALARSVHALTAAGAPGPERAGEIEHFVVRMGDIRGWATRLFFYAFDPSIASTASAASAAIDATAVVLVQSPSRARLEPVLYALAEKAREGRAILAWHGPPAPIEELSAGARPDLVLEADPARALGALAKRILESLRSA
jgi:hypothetical protein